MKTSVKVLIVVALAAAVVTAVALRNRGSVEGGAGRRGSVEREAVAPSALPRLVDLGAGKCIPCKMMAPILEELKKEYAGRMAVEFIDVWQNPGAGKQYGVETIPTQIFYDADGKELFRHVGFFAKDDILAKWKELGVNLDSK
jgi:thioredoxin 1